MRNKIYKCDYDGKEAYAEFRVDFDKLTNEDAKTLLDFFSWDYDSENNTIDELINMYAMIAIRVATANNYNEFGVKNWFEDNEGYLRIDGSYGVELIKIEPYEFDEFMCFDMLSSTLLYIERVDPRL